MPLLHAPATFPVLRWLALLWLLVWVPVYWRSWGPANFLHYCDIAIFLACIGFWLGNSLLLSMAAVGSMVGYLAWCLDAAWRLAIGHHLVGGTEYMWDPRFPLFARLLSLFHVVFPVVFLYAVSRVGYDPRALAYQSILAAVLLVAARFTNPALNINEAFRDPILHRPWGPAPVHLVLMYVGLVLIFFLPVHLVLRRLFPRPLP
jgi:hypothetical protein